MVDHCTLLSRIAIAIARVVRLSMPNDLSLTAVLIFPLPGTLRSRGGERDLINTFDTRTASSSHHLDALLEAAHEHTCTSACQQQALASFTSDAGLCQVIHRLFWLSGHYLQTTYWPWAPHLALNHSMSTVQRSAVHRVSLLRAPLSFDPVLDQIRLDQSPRK